MGNRREPIDGTLARTAIVGRLSLTGGRPECIRTGWKCQNGNADLNSL